VTQRKRGIQVSTEQAPSPYGEGGMRWINQLLAFRFLLITIILLVSVSASAQSEIEVFITKTGAKFHRATCRYAETGWEATLTEAKDRGLTPCLVCKPGGGSATTPASSSSTETNSLRSTTPSTSEPASTTSSSQCSATTKAGARCSRKVVAGSRYCWQHEG
jgi:hypothetical protein